MWPDNNPSTNYLKANGESSTITYEDIDGMLSPSLITPSLENNTFLSCNEDLVKWKKINLSQLDGFSGNKD